MRALSLCISFLPTISLTYNHRLYTECFSFLLYLLISLLCQLVPISNENNERFWGVTAGNWQRLENLFLVSSFQFLFLRLTSISNFDLRGTVQWMLLLVTLWCQENTLNHFFSTLFPISLSILIMVIKWTFQKSFPYANIYFLCGLLFETIAILFLYDPMNQIEWFLWQLLIGIGSFCLVKSALR